MLNRVAGNKTDTAIYWLSEGRDKLPSEINLVASCYLLSFESRPVDLQSTRVRGLVTQPVAGFRKGGTQGALAILSRSIRRRSAANANAFPLITAKLELVFPIRCRVFLHDNSICNLP